MVWNLEGTWSAGLGRVVVGVPDQRSMALNPSSIHKAPILLVARSALAFADKFG